MSEKTDNDQFLATARKRFESAREEEKELRDKFISDLKFASPDGDDQWDPILKQMREAAGRPAMAFPRCHVFVNQVANDARQQKPQIKYAQSDSGDKETAEIMEGIARHIQYASDAQVAYETAVEYSAGGSFGYYRILTDYVDDDSDDQEILVKPVLDPLTVYGVLVPAIFGRKPKWWFVVEDIPKDEFKEQYGDTLMASLGWDEAAKLGGWVGDDYVRIAEYWYVEETKIQGKRKPKVTIKFCKTNGIDVLPGSERVWLGTKCPMIPVLGKQMIREGKPQLFSVVRPQKSAQQMLNYSKSRIAETLSQAPVSPYMLVEGQDTGYEKEWATINTSPRPAVHYKAVDVAGRPAPPPQRQVYEPPITSLSNFVAQEVDDMKATSGIFDASLGARSNETSGKAILQRQQQTNLTTMHFMDNLERSFKQAGEVIGELIPKIYDGSRIVKILGPDETQKLVTINQQHTGADGKPKMFDLSKSEGAWVITMGRSFSSKRQESFDMMQSVVQSAPNLLPMFGDVMFRNSDLAGADEVAERFHAMLPPALQQGQDQMPPQAKAAIAQMQQQGQLMQAQLSKLEMERAAKVVEHSGKMQEIQAKASADMQLEKMKLENSITLAEINTKAQNIEQRLTFVEDMWKQLHGQAHDFAMQKDDQAHQQAITAQQAQHQSDLADQTAANQSVQSAQDAAQSQAAQQGAD